jgi:cyclic pyranopterin monophosphate synthase
MKRAPRVSAAFHSPKMIDISEKPIVRREAIAEGTIELRRSTMRLISEGKIEKGDPLQIASIGGLQAVKSTPSALMMCHPIPIESSSLEFFTTAESIRVRATVLAYSKTGVEMESLYAVTTALLNIWDVVKKYEKNDMGQYPETRIRDVHILKKSKAGFY